MSSERWLDIPGHAGSYQVSDSGRVRSLDREVTHGRYGSQMVAGRVLKPQDNGCGRMQVGLREAGVNRMHQVHRLVMAAFVGPCPAGLEVCHNNGNAKDNSLINLRYDTHGSNMLDRKKHGTDPQEYACRNGHLRSEHPQHWWRGGRSCNTCRRDRISRANSKRFSNSSKGAEA